MHRSWLKGGQNSLRRTNTHVQSDMTQAVLLCRSWTQMLIRKSQMNTDALALMGPAAQILTQMVANISQLTYAHDPGSPAAQILTQMVAKSSRMKTDALAVIRPAVQILTQTVAEHFQMNTNAIVMTDPAAQILPQMCLS